MRSYTVQKVFSSDICVCFISLGEKTYLVLKLRFGNPIDSQRPVM